MEHLCLVSAGFIFLILILLWKFLMRKHAVVGTYDYLEVLSYHVWKPGRQIKKEMEKLKGGWLSYVEVYQALAHLEDEGFVERRVRDREVEDPDNPEEKIKLKVHDFKLTSTGIRRKDDLRNTEKLPASAAIKPI